MVSTIKITAQVVSDFVYLVSGAGIEPATLGL